MMLLPWFSGRYNISGCPPLYTPTRSGATSRRVNRQRISTETIPPLSVSRRSTQQPWPTKLLLLLRSRRELSSKLLQPTHQSWPNVMHSAIFNDPANLQRNFPVPVCQCVQIKPLGAQSAGAPERFRIVLSDIKNFVQSMVATG